MSKASAPALLVLTLALVLAAPGLAPGGAGRAAAESLESQQIQVIRRIKVSEVQPVDGWGSNGSPQPGVHPNGNQAQPPALKVLPQKVRFDPTRALPVRTTAVRAAVTVSNPLRSQPVRPVPLRLNSGPG